MALAESASPRQNAPAGRRVRDRRRRGLRRVAARGRDHRDARHLDRGLAAVSARTSSPSPVSSSSSCSSCRRLRPLDRAAQPAHPVRQRPDGQGPADAAEPPLLAGHRPARPRHAQPPHLRRPREPGHRRPGQRLRVAARRDLRHRRRLLPGLARDAHHARHRRHAGLPHLPAGDRPVVVDQQARASGCSSWSSASSTGRP